MSSYAKKATFVTTSHWGAFEVDVQDDRIVGTRPFAHDPCPHSIPDILPAAVHHRSRVTRPAIRKGWLTSRRGGSRGSDAFVDVPWDEALDIVADEIKRVRSQHGNEAIFGGSYGWASAGRFHHAQSQLHRFLNCAGGYVASRGSYSTACAQAIIPHVFGAGFQQLVYEHQDSWEIIAQNAKTLVMFGGINPKNAMVSMGGATEHVTQGWLAKFMADGMHCVNVGPQRTDAPDGCDWLKVKPGSDTALMLALAHTLHSEGLTDTAFLDTYTTGFDRFEPYLMGDADGVAKSAEWASQLCGLEPGAIRDLARRMASTPTFITVAWSLQRAHHGEQPYWMSAVLAAMLGQIGLPGCGVGYGYGAIGGVGKRLLQMRGITVPQGVNPIQTDIPVARIADMLNNPGGAYDFNGVPSTYPDIRLVYWAGGNPFHHHQDLNHLHSAWQKPETIIVHEPWWTPTAKRADIVLPATTPYEREDIGRSKLDQYLFHMPQIIPPQGDARDDYAILSSLADRLGFGPAFTENRTASEWIAHLYDDYRDCAAQDGIEAPTLDVLKRENWVRLPIDDEGPNHNFLVQFRNDPVGAPLPTPSGRIEIFSGTIAGFDYADCPGHPVWLPPDEWLGAQGASGRLHLVSPQPGDKLHSQMECALADVEDTRPATLVMHPGDADTRAIQSGDLVRVFNDRGACRARALLSDDIMRGVVSLPTGAWFSDPGSNLDADGNPNVLTRDVGTSRLGQGSSAHSALVDVAPLTP